MHKRILLLILLIIALLLSACGLPAAEINSRFDNSTNEAHVGNTATFHFIDVGQGDCTLISGGGKNILIDAGTAESGSTVYSYLKELEIDYIDYFIGTHPHEDHLGGATSVLSSIDIGTVFLNSDTSSAYFYERFVDTLAKRRKTPLKPNMDCIYEVGPFRIKFLSPTKDFQDTNDNSLITMIQFGNVKALFMGDAERTVEAELIKSGSKIEADILKVGHHGSRYASSAEFLNVVYPSVAIIQCGEDNSYGHPHQEALNRLNAINASVIRTDKNGNIILTTDGETIRKADGETLQKAESPNKISLIYIGNIKSKVFHTESCPNLPSEKNRIEFSLRQDAVNAGYSACRNCNP